MHWDDVDEWANVWQHIMDAIKLPLKHPHLYPKWEAGQEICFMAHQVRAKL
jgi:SpoVK/Ycf46/Vps4 family AAA+-type ATPase